MPVPRNDKKVLSAWKSAAELEMINEADMIDRSPERRRRPFEPVLVPLILWDHMNARLDRLERIVREAGLK